MKLTYTAQPNSGKLEFNDLGSFIKGVSPQYRFVNLNSGDEVYLPDSGEVLVSAISGDISRFKKAGKIAVNETIQLAPGDTHVMAHNFGFLPNIVIAHQAGADWVDCSFETNQVSVTSNNTMTETIIQNISNLGLVLHVRIS